VSRATLSGPLGRLLILAGAVALAGSLAAGGCASADQRQTKVIDQVNPPGALTPLQRGAVRSQALRAAEAAVAAFRSGDPAKMRPYFSDQYVAYYTRLKASDAKAGKVRVRVHTGTSVDITNMDQTGREVEVTYTFKNGSYFADLSGKALTKPTGKASEIDLVMDKSAKGWIVTRMFSGKDELL
jgi:hypothetical protein